MKLVRESLKDKLKGPDKEEVLNQLKQTIKNETNGEIDLEFSSFKELIEKLLLNVSSLEEWSVYPQTIEDVNVGTYYLMVPSGIISILERIPFVGYLTDSQAHNLQDIRISSLTDRSKLEQIGVGFMTYEYREGNLDGDLYFILDDKGQIFKAMFLQY